jgi:hypothetical protein
MLLRETPSSRARTLTFSPASIRRKASSLNSRLNRLGSLVLNQSSPRKENSHRFPCLSPGVQSSLEVVFAPTQRSPAQHREIVIVASPQPFNRLALFALHRHDDGAVLSVSASERIVAIALGAHVENRLALSSPRTSMVRMT